MARASSEALEPRLLYSADPLGAAAAWDGSAQAWRAAAVQASGDTLAETQPLRVIVIDHRVRDVHDLVAGLLQGTPAGERWELLELNAHSDGLQQLSRWLESRRDVAALHLLAHGEEGALWLGQGRVDAQVLRAQAAVVQTWSDALRSDADILLYGCDVAATDLGLQFVAQWAALSGADVAASRNTTGQGGDWTLEVQAGVVEAPTLAAPQWSGQLALTPQGGETRVNTSTDGQQTLIWSTRQVAMDSNGNVIVVWEDGAGIDGDGSGVFAQRYGANGVPQGGQFRVNSVTSGNQANPEVAMDVHGNFVVVWNSTGQDGSGGGIYAQRFNASGVPQGSEFRVNQNTADDQMAPAVAMDAAGNFVITWESRNQDTSGWGVYRRHFSALGVSLSGELPVPGSTNGNQREPAIAMDSSGNFVIAWTDEVLDGSSSGVYAQRYNASGTPQGGQFRVNITTADDQGYPQLAMDASGFVIAWESNLQDGSEYALIGRRYNAAGVAQGGEMLLNSTTTGTQWNANVALAPGGFLASWTSIGQDGDVEGVYLRQFTLDGTPLSPEVRVNSSTAGSQDFGGVAANAQGHVTVVWNGNGTGDPTGIFMQRFTADAPGISVSTAGPLATTEAGGQDSFSVVLDSAPTANVSIAISVSRALEATLSTSLLTFTPGNWSTPQTVMVTGRDDALADGNQSYAVVLGPASSADSLYNGLNPADVSGVNAGTDTVNTVTVNTTADTLNGNTSSLYALVENPGADGVISLREALTATNNTPNGSGGVDRIEFDIPGTGIHVITPLTPLPDIRDGVRLDARTDTSFAANGNRPAIVLDGNNLVADGLAFLAGSDGSLVRGLVIRDFAGAGIELNPGTSGITVAGNYLGRLGPDGEDAGPGQENYDGLRVSGTGHTIGGAAPLDGNIIAGNAGDGVILQGTGHTVQGNWVGTNPSGATGLGNGQDGISPTATATLIGGTLAGQGNVIAHNQRMGLDILGGGTGIAILGNRIEGNGTLGIDLNADGVTPNDPGDADTGRNGLQNFPALFSAGTSGVNTTVVGSFSSQPGTAYRIEFFSTPTGDAAGHGEGSTYLGFVNVVTDGNGDAPINTTLSGVPVAPGHAVTATATVDLGGGQLGSTSEFSRNVMATIGGRTLSGSVLEDVNGDGQVLDDGRGLFNAAVTLYLDDGDNALDAGDTRAASVVADAAGRYSANNLAAGTYWVVADSRSLLSGTGLNPGSAAADTWAEQTYGAAGSVAWNGRAYGFTAAAGTFYGGQRQDRGDDAAGLLSAEHVVRVDVSGGDATAVDFGFSFNAITHGRDGDEVAGGNRSIQGSLRQFIQNSNALVGMQSSQFRITPADPSWLAGRAVISLASALPAATDALRLDATTQTLWVGNTNAGDFRIASSTGTERWPLPPVQRPEVELRGSPGSPSILDLQGSGSRLSGFALLRTGVANNSSHAAVRVMADGAVITGNVFGATATDLGDPIAVGRVQAVGIRLLGSANVTNNIFANISMHAISAEAGADGFSIAGNHIAFPALTGNTQAGVAVRDVTGGLIQGNIILNSGGNAIELLVNADNVIIDANSLLGSGALPWGEDSAVDILAGSDNNLLTRNLIDGSVGNGVFISGSQGNVIGQPSQGNQITGNGGNGIVVTNANGTRIRGNHIGTDASGTLVDGQARNGVDIGSGSTNTLLGGVGPGEGNRIAHNGMDGISIDNAAGSGHALLGNQLWGNGSLGIDLNDDGIINPLDPLDADRGPNGLQNHPLITSATRAGGRLTIEGSLQAQPFTNYRIELMTLSPAQADGSGHGEGAEFLRAVDVITDAAGNARFSVANLLSAVPAGNVVTATATVITGRAAFGSTSEYAPNASILAVNSAPVLDNTGAMVLTSIDEDAVNNPGQTVASIIASAGGDRITDVDAGAPEGIAVTGWAVSAMQSPGWFEFSLNGGQEWQLLPQPGTLGANLAVLLRSTDLIRFVPQGVDAEAVTLSFRAWDASSGAAGDVASVASTGGSSAFSTATETASLTVTAVNDAPVITSNGAGAVASISLPEGNTAVTRVAAADADGPVLSYVLAGGADQALFAVQSTTGDLVFLNPTRFAGRASANGDNVYEVVVQADDGAGGTDTQTLQVTVTAVTHTVIVSTTADDALANDGDTRSVQALLLSPGSDGLISLREALVATNATPNGSGGADRIVFDIAAPLVAGTHRVALTRPLPTVTDTLILDASTEPDALATGAPVVVLDGSAFSGSGLVLTPAAAGSLVRGMAMEGFAQAALWLQPGVSGARLE
ncbi:MAG: DUF4347 domain-containing protein, partial [Rubrivivax sp.]|nr:DUF4347 domain-containing protein [Rubrivivax sp.]